MDSTKSDSNNMAIPQRIITIWLNQFPMPELIKKCIESQNIDGYEHMVITLDNVYKGSKYVNTCLENKEWVRAADYLRLYYLAQYGGVYLDADTTVLPDQDFDKFLYNRMFAFKEKSGYLNNGFIGSEPAHPLLAYVTLTMENNFRTDHNLFYSGMQFFCEAYYIADRNALGMAIYDDTELKDIIIHHGMKSWLK